MTRKASRYQKTVLQACSVAVVLVLLALIGSSRPIAALDGVPPNTWVAMNATGDGPNYGGLPGKRGWIQVAYDLGSSKVTLFGGDNDTYLSDLWQYDVRSNRWHLARPHPDLGGPCRRDNHNFVYDVIGKRFWMWNGAIGNEPILQPGCGKYPDSTDQWTYDPAANEWTRRGRSLDRMLASGAAYDPISRTIVQFGGEKSLTSETTDWTFIMDAATGEWKRLGGLGASPPPSVNIQGGLVYMTNVKQMLLFGGRHGSGSKIAHNQTWSFDPAGRKWRRLSPVLSPPPRDLHSMVYDEAHRVVILHGGRGADRNTVFSDTWVFDPVKGTWTDITARLGATGPPMHYGSGVYDPVNRVMLMIPGQWGRDTWVFRYEPLTP
jgi:Galactose oxidase, central domain